MYSYIYITSNILQFARVVELHANNVCTLIRKLNPLLLRIQFHIFSTMLSSDSSFRVEQRSWISHQQLELLVGYIVSVSSFGGDTKNRRGVHPETQITKELTWMESYSLLD